MKYPSTLIAFAATAIAQSIVDLPSCSLECVASAVQNVGCGLTDFGCSCSKAEQLTPAVTPCVQRSCPDATDQENVIVTLKSICASAGVPIVDPQPTQGSSGQALPLASSAPTISIALSQTESSEATPTQPSVPAILISSSTRVPSTNGSGESCEQVTVTHTVTISKTTVAAVPSAPYPTGPASSQRPIQVTGTGISTSAPPLFTGAGMVLNIPAGFAGLFGLAAFVF